MKIFHKVLGRLLFLKHSVELHTRGHPACKLWLRYGNMGGLGE